LPAATPARWKIPSPSTATPYSPPKKSTLPELLLGPGPQNSSRTTKDAALSVLAFSLPVRSRLRRRRSGRLAGFERPPQVGYLERTLKSRSQPTYDHQQLESLASRPVCLHCSESPDEPPGGGPEIRSAPASRQDPKHYSEDGAGCENGPIVLPECRQYPTRDGSRQYDSVIGQFRSRRVQGRQALQEFPSATKYDCKHKPAAPRRRWPAL